MTAPAGIPDLTPGTRPAHAPGFPVAHVRDPDGHKLACAQPDDSPQEDR